MPTTARPARNRHGKLDGGTGVGVDDPVLGDHGAGDPDIERLS